MAYVGNNLTVQQYAPQVAYFSGNGSTTAFTLPTAVVSSAQIIVVVANVPQNPSSAYTVSDTTLTFTSAPPTGTNNIWVEYTSLQTNTIAPSAGTVNTAQLGTITNISSGNSALTLQTGSVPTTAITVDASQNVGIGASSVLSKLQVVANQASYVNDLAQLTIIGTNTNQRLLIGYNTTADKGFIQATKVGTAYQDLVLQSGGGNLLVGTTSPAGSEKISVITSTATTAWFQSTNASASGVVGIYSVIPSTAFNTNCTHFSGQTASVNTWFLYGNGTTSYVSDQNLKKNIVTTRDGYLDDLAKLRVVKYQWKINTDDSPVELGLIAQEVAEVFPNLVKDSIPAKEGDATNKVILGSVLQPILIKSVQELYDLVKEQQALITDLTARLSALEAK